MDTVVNYNNTPNSQIVPPLTERVFPEIYAQIKADEFRGNFLSVVGRQDNDTALMDAFRYHYNRVKSGKKHSIHTLGNCANETRDNVLISIV